MGEAPPYVTGILLAAIAYVAWQITGLVPTEASLEPVWFSAEAMQAGEWHRLVTSVLAHGGPLHLAFNAIALLSLAGLERRLGSLTYAGVFLAAGVAGNLAHALVRSGPVVGASGGIFGLLGVLLALAPATRLFFFGLPVPAAILLPGYAALVMLVPGLETLAPIAHVAHLGGLVVGLLAALAIAAPRAVGNLAYAAAAFAGVGLIAVNVEAVGWARFVETAARDGIGAFVTLAWPALAGLLMLGLVLHRLPDPQTQHA